MRYVIYYLKNYRIGIEHCEANIETKYIKDRIEFIVRIGGKRSEVFVL
ncbi:MULTISPECIES: hypothetical protein [Clostridium]|nr:MULTISPECIES: hypothetical protein [Clostridium]MDU4546130.1 hypothetical protein [Clostridium botulinum]